MTTTDSSPTTWGPWAPGLLGTFSSEELVAATTLLGMPSEFYLAECGADDPAFAANAGARSLLARGALAFDDAADEDLFDDAIDVDGPIVVESAPVGSEEPLLLDRAAAEATAAEATAAELGDDADPFAELSLTGPLAAALNMQIRTDGALAIDVMSWMGGHTTLYRRDPAVPLRLADELLPDGYHRYSLIDPADIVTIASEVIGELDTPVGIDAPPSLQRDSDGGLDEDGLAFFDDLDGLIVAAHYTTSVGESLDTWSVLVAGSGAAWVLEPERDGTCALVAYDPKTFAQTLERIVDVVR